MLDDTLKNEFFIKIFDLLFLKYYNYRCLARLHEDLHLTDYGVAEAKTKTVSSASMKTF